MQDFSCNYMHMTNMPAQYCPMMTMPQQQLETMYPMTHRIISPVVERTCDKMSMAYGPMFTPTDEQIESMTDDVYGNVEMDVETAIRQSNREGERQILGGGRRLLRDFIRTLLILSLIRRRRPFFGFPGQFGPGFGGYPGY